MKWKIAVDRGGTFTDVIGVDGRGNFHTAKLLSTSPYYSDASIEGIRRLMGLSGNAPLPQGEIAGIRFGTTVATNALLERKGGKIALFITHGFADLLEIGYQSRPDLFDLTIKKGAPLYSTVIEVEERLDADGRVIRPLDEQALHAAILKLKPQGMDSAAVVLLHAWKNPAHEKRCREILNSAGMEAVFLSHETMNLIKVVSRGQSTVVDAFLSPVIHRYLDGIRAATGDIPIEFMQSSGGLSLPEHFRGKDAILSGPAGGVIAVSRVAQEMRMKGVIGFDMGGTSTDVSRYDGEFEKVYEKCIEGMELQKEMLNIHAVAAGGGSVLWFDGQKMRVGPESSGADPGPACYDLGGPLSVTDANLLTGRIEPRFFPATFGPERKSPLKKAAAETRFEALTKKISEATGKPISVEEAAVGYLQLANEKMALAIREISIARGSDVRDYALVCFGGAGGQHACEVASLLKMKYVIFHPLGGLMSAYGIGLARPERKQFKTVLAPYNDKTDDSLKPLFEAMEKELIPSGRKEGTTVTCSIDLRTQGSDSVITLPFARYEENLAQFRHKHETLFGFTAADLPLEVVNVRLEVRENEDFLSGYFETPESGGSLPAPAEVKPVYFRDRFIDTPIFKRSDLFAGAMIEGPAIIMDSYSTLVIDPGFSAEVKKSGILLLERHAGKEEKRVKSTATSSAPDPMLLEVFNNLFMSVAANMGHTLKNTAHSVNIKERLDFSCALFDKEGNLVANAPHIPVHLGAMADSVKAVIEERQPSMQAGDLYMINNPYRGGSHLPDITVLSPLFSDAGEILFFVAARGHHADIGGITPGSMPPASSHIDEEGILIDATLIVRGGLFLEEEVKALLTSHPYPARNLTERLSDLKAKIAACHKGAEELTSIMARYGRETVFAYMAFIRQNAEFSIKKALAGFLKTGNDFSGSFEDRLDDGTAMKVRFTIAGGNHPPETVRAIIDFTGTGPEHERDNLNAPLSVTRAAVLYVLRVITETDIPLNSGCLNPVKIIVPEGSLLNPRYPAPVASGNVETSQRIVDVLLGALGVAAASQGTMNNLLFQVEGDTPYYETIAGGAGATEEGDGASGVQVHMTNTRMTDPEILEFRHPKVRLERFSLRRRSGGAGRHKGGDGVIRELKFLASAEVSVISERRVYPPWGMAGGRPGATGRNSIRKVNGSRKRAGHRFEGKLTAGEAVIIETPGGGGYGTADEQGNGC